MLCGWQVFVSEEPRGSIAVVQALHGPEAHRRRLEVELICIFVLVLAALLLGLTGDELEEPLVLFAACGHAGSVLPLELRAGSLQLVDEPLHPFLIRGSIAEVQVLSVDQLPPGSSDLVSL